MIAIEQLSTELASDNGLVRAVDALSLTIESGQTFALVGESGCGKSMTALSLLRLLPDSGRVTAGTVTLDGTELMKTLGNEAGGLPFTLVLNAQSGVQMRKLGKLTSSDVQSWI